jgi:hypothetical protein
MVFLVAQIGTAVERRSLREIESLLFKLKRQYRTLHKRYSHLQVRVVCAPNCNACFDATTKRPMNENSHADNGAVLLMRSPPRQNWLLPTPIA